MSYGNKNNFNMKPTESKEKNNIQEKHEHKNKNYDHAQKHKENARKVEASKEDSVKKS